MIDDDVIVSLNVAVTGEFTATVVALLVGETDETVGTIVSSFSMYVSNEGMLTDIPKVL